MTCHFLTDYIMVAFHMFFVIVMMMMHLLMIVMIMMHLLTPKHI